MSVCSTLTGIVGTQSDADLQMLSAIRTSITDELDEMFDNSKALHVFDACPWINAMGNTIAGKGYENIAPLGYRKNIFL